MKNLKLAGLVLSGVIGAGICNQIDNYEPTEVARIEDCQNEESNQDTVKDPSVLVDSVVCATKIGVENVLDTKASSNILGVIMGVGVAEILSVIARRLDKKKNKFTSEDYF